MNCDGRAILIEDVVIDLSMNGSDRGALVRSTDNPGVIVFLLTSEAKRTAAGVSVLGPLIIELRNLIINDLGGDGSIYRNFPCSTPVTLLFNHCDETPKHWNILIQKLGSVEFYAISFSGPICHRVAEICNAYRCPCSLDPEKAPSGYNITRMLNKP